MVKGMKELVSGLDKKEKIVAMLAPSFVAEFDYPKIITMLKELGIDKVVELTFGAKMINREYHEQLKSSKGLVISSVCPGVVETIRSQFPKYEKNLIHVDSPMIAMAKICKKAYPSHKTFFVSPCNFKKIEASCSDYVDYVIDYSELHELFKKQGITPSGKKGRVIFDRFYNDYTKIYPLAGGLSKTAHLKGIIKPDETNVIDGIKGVIEFLKNPDKKIKLLDANFCIGGCIGGPYLTSRLSLEQRKQRVMDYMQVAKVEAIPEERKGLIEKSKGIKFSF